MPRSHFPHRLVLLVACVLLAGVATYVIAIQAVVLSAVSLFILTRPLPPHERR